MYYFLKIVYGVMHAKYKHVYQIILFFSKNLIVAKIKLV